MSGNDQAARVWNHAWPYGIPSKGFGDELVQMDFFCHVAFMDFITLRANSAIITLNFGAETNKINRMKLVVKKIIK